MASKLARQITMLLYANDLVLYHRTEEILNLVDRALQGRTISKKEVARLQDSERILSSVIDANNELLRAKQDLRTELEGWKELAIARGEDVWALRFNRANLNHKVEDLRTKLWDAEQETQDLKRNFEEVREVFWNAFNRSLALENWNSLKFIVEEIKPTSEPEYIIPPPCLKPNDAITWSNNQVEAKWKDPNATL